MCRSRDGGGSSTRSVVKSPRRCVGCPWRNWRRSQHDLLRVIGSIVLFYFFFFCLGLRRVDPGIAISLTYGRNWARYREKVGVTG